MPPSSLLSASSSTDAAPALLSAADGEAVSVFNADGQSDYVIVCDHAGNRIPQALGSLGLSDRDLASHIAWDLGARGVAEQLALRLDAPLVLQHFSRLVIDCNRQPGAADSITTAAEWGVVSGNEKLDAQAIAARRAAVFTPYHEAIDALLERRRKLQRRSLLVAMHSFTPAFRGTARPWHIGVMHDEGSKLGAALIEFLGRDERLRVGANEPFAYDDAVDYTLPHHGRSRGIPNVGLEIRQDLLADAAEQAAWAGRLAKPFKRWSTSAFS